MAGTSASLILDANGLAEEGVLTPWVDVPIARLSGSGNSGGAVGFMAGVCETMKNGSAAHDYPRLSVR